MPDGATYREHLAAVERAGQDTGELDPLPTPLGCEELLATFWQLRRSAGGDGMSQKPITHSEVLAWQQLQRVELEPMEVDLLFAMDNAALTAFAENAAKAAKQQRSTSK